MFTAAEIYIYIFFFFAAAAACAIIDILKGCGAFIFRVRKSDKTAYA